MDSGKHFSDENLGNLNVKSEKLDEDENVVGEEAQLISRIEKHVANENYKEAYRLIENGCFTQLEKMVTIWDDAHYAEKEKLINKPLTPLMRFRIRQRYLPPASICPSRERPTLALPSKSKKILCRWYEDHKDNPFPSKSEKDELARITGLTLTQVQTWFANLRRRKHCRHLNTSLFESKEDTALENNDLCVTSDSDRSEKAVQAAESMIRLSQSPPTFNQSLSTLLEHGFQWGNPNQKKSPLTANVKDSSVPPLLPIPKSSHLRYVPARYPTVLPSYRNIPYWLPTMMNLPMGMPLSVYPPRPVETIWEQNNKVLQHLQRLQERSLSENNPV